MSKHNPIPPIAAGMSAYHRGCRVLREFCEITATFLSVHDIAKLDAHMLCASDGVTDEGEGVILAYEALVALDFNGEATQFRKTYYTTLSL